MTDLPPSLSFGPFVIVQAAVALAIGMGVAFSWFRGERGKGRATSSLHGNGIQMFFDGPLIKALETLQGTYRVMTEMRTENKETVAEFRDRHEEELNILRDISETLRNDKTSTNKNRRRRR